MLRVQALWLVIVFAVPVCLMAAGNWRLLLAWVVAITCTDVPNVRGAVNVTATAVAGLLLLPYSVRVLLIHRRAGPVGWAVVHLGWLVFLGLAFGVAFPWTDAIQRPFNLQAPGRTILYLLRETANLSIAVFVGNELARSGRPDRLFHAVMAVCAVTSCVALAEFATGVSYYVLFSTGHLEPTYWNLRVRGLNFEPRGLALVNAHGILVCLLVLAIVRRLQRPVPILGVNGAALFLSGSTSGLIATLGGVAAVTLGQAKVRRYAVRSALLLALAGAAFAAWQWDRIVTWQLLLTQRVGTTDRFGVARGWFEQLVYRMEIFDTSAALFLAAHPTYLFVGTGPGLMSIPATAFMPLTAVTRDYVSTGLNSPPTMGWLLELSNGGFVGLLLWFGFVRSSARALRWTARAGTAARDWWSVAHWALLGAAAIYLLSAGFLSSVWALFMGLGFGASFLRQRSAIHNEPGDAG